ncbi:tigger transposable element-derived protein 1-like [Palaemon carinicauda]|uniref:tigger transposable element-derived protein 1-like n=1 Tax=Palaemon carinicauda TaxID=392227 RepID=UPI0035B68FA5
MERLLLLWIKEKQLAGDSITEAIICEKASAVYEDLKLRESAESGETSTTVENFKASRGRFDNSKKRTEIHSVMSHGEAASCDVAEEGYIPQQIFNCDETGLVCKKMPRTFNRAEEKKLPGHKPMKDRLTLALCANVSGDCKVKPLLVYHSENPSAFKSPKILKEKLQVMWRANPKAWVTRYFFTEWFNLCFGPAVNKYLLEENLLLKCLLNLDNALVTLLNLKNTFLMN